MFVTYGGSDLLYYHYILVPVYWDTSCTCTCNSEPLFSFINPKCSHVLAFPFFFCTISKDWPYEPSRPPCLLTKWGSIPQERGVKIILEPPFCAQTRPWRQMKSAFFLWKQSNIANWFENNGHDVQQRHFSMKGKGLQDIIWKLS